MADMSVDVHHLAAAYVLDALDPAERIEFEVHHPACEICRNDVREFRLTVAALASLTATPPPRRLRCDVLRRVARTRQPSRRRLRTTPQ